MTGVLERGFLTVFRIDPHTHMASVTGDVGVLPALGHVRRPWLLGVLAVSFPSFIKIYYLTYNIV